MWLKGVALAKWRELEPKLRHHQMVTELDVDLLATACMYWGIYVEAYHAVTEAGVTAQNRQGRMVKHPALQVLRDHSAAFRECLARLGMTPVDRGRLDVPEDADAAASFFGVR
ncbi:MAG TPA: phage terminase small subunit P27 family [bacterium]|jgi:P27 family predicted phage terminase small subunit|nr:phage terminase small subunit P27 family [bacterium]